MKDVQEFVKNIVNKAKDTIGLTTDSVKGKMDTLFHRTPLTIEELVEFIMKHPNTEFDMKEFLGFQYKFFQLKLEEASFYLETKGDGDYVLELTITSPEKILYEYHAYEHTNFNPDEIIHLPEAIHHLVH